MSEVDAKEKILVVARILFGEHGYDGTSVRDISKQADVNISSINYYFKSKENLFSEVMKRAYDEISEAIGVFFTAEDVNLEDALIDIFKYFLSHSHDLLSHFMMMLSSNQKEYLLEWTLQERYYGPPGGDLLCGTLKKEVGKDISEESLDWALKVLFSHVVHISIIHNCCLRDQAHIPFSQMEDLEKGIRRLSRVVIRELQETLNDNGSLRKF